MFLARSGGEHPCLALKVKFAAWRGAYLVARCPGQDQQLHRRAEGVAELARGLPHQRQFPVIEPALALAGLGVDRALGRLGRVVGA